MRVLVASACHERGDVHHIRIRGSRGGSEVVVVVFRLTRTATITTCQSIDHICTEIHLCRMHVSIDAFDFGSECAVFGLTLLNSVRILLTFWQLKFCFDLGKFAPTGYKFRVKCALFVLFSAFSTQLFFYCPCTYHIRGFTVSIQPFTRWHTSIVRKFTTRLFHHLYRIFVHPRFEGTIYECTMIDLLLLDGSGLFLGLLPLDDPIVKRSTTYSLCFTYTIRVG